MKRAFLASLAAGALLAAGAAHAAAFVVSATGNSSTDGVGLSTIALTSGEAFQVSVVRQTSGAPAHCPVGRTPTV
jgi:hypothetical protein